MTDRPHESPKPNATSAALQFQSEDGRGHQSERFRTLNLCRRCEVSLRSSRRYMKKTTPSPDSDTQPVRKCDICFRLAPCWEFLVSDDRRERRIRPGGKGKKKEGTDSNNTNKTKKLETNLNNTKESHNKNDTTTLKEGANNAQKANQGQGR